MGDYTLMKKLFVILIPLLITSWVFNAQVYAVENTVESSAKLLKFSTSKEKDWRKYKLKVFLAKHKSELFPYSDTIIKVADENQIPWNLLVAISGVESTFCKRIPVNSYNCWGWNNGNYYFDDYKHAITHISKTIKLKYFDRGLTTPEKMSRVYAPPSKTWGWKVRFFMNRIEEIDVPEIYLASQFSI